MHSKSRSIARLALVFSTLAFASVTRADQIVVPLDFEGETGFFVPESVFIELEAALVSEDLLRRELEKRVASGERSKEALALCTTTASKTEARLDLQIHNELEALQALTNAHQDLRACLKAGTSLWTNLLFGFAGAAVGSAAGFTVGHALGVRGCP